MTVLASFFGAVTTVLLGGIFTLECVDYCVHYVSVEVLFLGRHLFTVNLPFWVSNIRLR